MAAYAGRCPVSAQCRIFGVPRSTCYHMLANPPAPKAQDRAREVRHRRLEAKDMQDIEGERPIQRVFRARVDGLAPCRPCTHVAADLTYVRAVSRWRYACLLVDLHDREIIGCSCGRRKDAAPAKAALSNVEFPLDEIEASHSDRGPEFCNAEIDAIPADFGIARSVSRPGNPHDSAVVESTSHILKRELVAGGRFGSDEELRAALFDWANWHDNFRIRSTLGCMSPVEFREAGSIIS